MPSSANTAPLAGVLVEGFRPGVTERLGVGYDTLAAINASDGARNARH